MKKIIGMVLIIKLIIAIVLLLIFSCKKELIKIDYNPLNYEGIWKTSQSDTISFSVNNNVPVLNYYLTGLLGINKVSVKALVRSIKYNSLDNSYNYSLMIPYINVSSDLKIVTLDSIIMRGRFILISENEMLAKYNYTEGRKLPVHEELYFTK